jgi:excisionase family DNA binding protein
VTGRAKDDCLWTVKDVARYFNCHESSVRRWIHDGLMPPSEKSFGSLRFDKAKVIEALRNTQAARDREKD